MIVFNRDIRNITGFSRSQAHRIMQRIRIIHNKRPGDFITILEFCAAYGLDVKEVKEYFKD